MIQKKVADVYTKAFSSVGERDTLSSTLKLFGEDRARVLAVVDSNGKYKGVLAQRWIRRSGVDLTTAKVETLVRSAPRVGLEDSLSRVARLMIESDIRQLPVFVKDNLVGFVTDENIIHGAVMDEWRNSKVSEIMTEKPYVVDEDESMGNVLSLFKDHDISHAPVVSRSRLVGLVSVVDFIDHIFHPLERQSRGDKLGEKYNVITSPVKNIMSTPVVTVKPDSTLREAEARMHRFRVHSLVVVEDGRPIGIVTKRDFLEPLAQTETEDNEIGIEFSVKEIEVDETDKRHIINDFKQFAERYIHVLGAGTLFVYMKTHGSSHTGEQFIHCRLQLRTSKGNFFSSSDGWNAEDNFRTALEHLERQVLRSKEVAQDKEYAKSYLNRIRFPTSEL